MPQLIQTALIQSSESSVAGHLPICVSTTVAIPSLPTQHHVLVKVLAVALNPNDYKMVTHYPMPGNMAGCDFCGVVEGAGEDSVHVVGARVCGAVFPYKPEEPRSGAFAQWLVADSRLLLQVPHDWTDVQGAALGGVGWSTACLAISHPEALALKGRPCKPSQEAEPVLVYGAATATGTMACQLLKLSGYTPLAVASAASAGLAIEYGAADTASYTSPTCVESVRAMAGGRQIRHALDCITDAESTAICFGALGRAGGRYVCLEEFQEVWRTRRAVRVKVVMGYEILGNRVDLGPSSVYSREVSRMSFEIGQAWGTEMQSLLHKRLVRAHRARELTGDRWEAILEGLSMLQRGEVRGQKLVVRI